MSKAGKTTPSHLVAPPGIQVNPSMVHKGVLGVYCTVPIAEGQLFGPFAGEVILEGDDEEVDYRFAWEVYDLKTNKLLHIINATKPKSGNWMRYVNCARFFEEQNIVSIQKGCEIFYKAIRAISAGEELLTWFAPLSGQSKRQSKRKPVQEDSGIKETKKTKKKPKSPENVDEKMKSLLLYEYLTKDEKLNKSKLEKKSKHSETDDKELNEEKSLTDATQFKSEAENAEKPETTVNNKSDGDVSPRSKPTAHSTSWLTPDMILHSEHSSDKVYQFVLREDHKAKTKNGGIMYACDICGAPYNRMFSLKRHIIRQHINAKYLSLGDITNCMVNVVQQEKSVQAKFHSKRTRKCKSELKPICDLDMPGLYRCFVCSELFDFAEDLREHECESMKQNKTKLLTCPICPLKFTLKVDLTRHKIVHSEGIETPFSCKICGKSFLSSTSLKKHIQFHSGNNFSCRICSNKFSSITELRQHINNKHLHSPSKQNELLKQTLMKSKQRFKVKNKQKIADDADSEQVADAIILVTSDSEGPAVTKVKRKRNRKFKKPHKKSISVDKPFICGVCGKAFPNSGRLKMHMSYHMYRVYTCRFCSVKHLKLADYRKHLQDVHPESLQNGILIRNGKDNKDTPPSTRVTRMKSMSEPKRQMSPVLVDEEETKEEEILTKKHSDKSDVAISDGFNPKDDDEVTDEELWEGEIKSPKPGKHSRFNFACTVCKKKFNCYVNMCRHRRLAHRTHKYGHPTLLRQREAAKLRDTVIVSDYIPIPTELSYANVAENIATNLNCYLDGGQEAITSCHKYIKPHNNELVMTSRNELPGPITWTRFNFPSSFQPWEGVVGYDIDEELLKVYDDLDIDKGVEGRNIRRKCRGSNPDESYDNVSDVKNRSASSDDVKCSSGNVTNKQEVENSDDAKCNSGNITNKQEVENICERFEDDRKENVCKNDPTSFTELVQNTETKNEENKNTEKGNTCNNEPSSSTEFKQNSDTKSSEKEKKVDVNDKDNGECAMVATRYSVRTKTATQTDGIESTSAINHTEDTMIVKSEDSGVLSATSGCLDSEDIKTENHLVIARKKAKCESSAELCGKESMEGEENVMKDCKTSSMSLDSKTSLISSDCKNSPMSSSKLFKPIDMDETGEMEVGNDCTGNILTRMDTDDPPLLKPAIVISSRRRNSESSSDEGSFGSPPPLLSPKEVDEDEFTEERNVELLDVSNKEVKQNEGAVMEVILMTKNEDNHNSNSDVNEKVKRKDNDGGQENLTDIKPTNTTTFIEKETNEYPSYDKKCLNEHLALETTSESDAAVSILSTAETTPLPLDLSLVDQAPLTNKKHSNILEANKSDESTAKGAVCNISALESKDKILVVDNLNTFSEQELKPVETSVNNSNTSCSMLFSQNGDLSNHGNHSSRQGLNYCMIENGVDNQSKTNQYDNGNKDLDAFNSIVPPQITGKQHSVVSPAGIYSESNSLPANLVNDKETDVDSNLSVRDKRTMNIQDSCQGGKPTCNEVVECEAVVSSANNASMESVNSQECGNKDISITTTDSVIKNKDNTFNTNDSITTISKDTSTKKDDPFIATDTTTISTTATIHTTTTTTTHTTTTTTTTIKDDTSSVINKINGDPPNTEETDRCTCEKYVPPLKTKSKKSKAINLEKIVEKMKAVETEMRETNTEDCETESTEPEEAAVSCVCDLQLSKNQDAQKHTDTCDLVSTHAKDKILAFSNQHCQQKDVFELLSKPEDKIPACMDKSEAENIDDVSAKRSEQDKSEMDKISVENSLKTDLVSKVKNPECEKQSESVNVLNADTEVLTKGDSKENKMEGSNKDSDLAFSIVKYNNAVDKVIFKPDEKTDMEIDFSTCWKEVCEQSKPDITKDTKCFTVFEENKMNEVFGDLVCDRNVSSHHDKTNLISNQHNVQKQTDNNNLTLMNNDSNIQLQKDPVVPLEHKQNSLLFPDPTELIPETLMSNDVIEQITSNGHTCGDSNMETKSGPKDMICETKENISEPIVMTSEQKECFRSCKNIDSVPVIEDCVKVLLISMVSQCEKADTNDSLTVVSNKNPSSSQCEKPVESLTGSHIHHAEEKDRTSEVSSKPQHDQFECKDVVNVSAADVAMPSKYPTFEDNNIATPLSTNMSDETSESKSKHLDSRNEVTMSSNEVDIQSQNSPVKTYHTVSPLSEESSTESHKYIATASKEPSKGSLKEPKDEVEKQHSEPKDVVASCENNKLKDSSILNKHSSLTEHDCSKQSVKEKCQLKDVYTVTEDHSISCASYVKTDIETSFARKDQDDHSATSCSIEVISTDNANISHIHSKLCSNPSSSSESSIIHTDLVVKTGVPPTSSESSVIDKELFENKTVGHSCSSESSVSEICTSSELSVIDKDLLEKKTSEFSSSSESSVIHKDLLMEKISQIPNLSQSSIVHKDLLEEKTGELSSFSQSSIPKDLPLEKTGDSCFAHKLEDNSSTTADNSEKDSQTVSMICEVSNKLCNESMSSGSNSRDALTEIHNGVSYQYKKCDSVGDKFNNLSDTDVKCGLVDYSVESNSSVIHDNQSTSTAMHSSLMTSSDSLVVESNPVKDGHKCNIRAREEMCCDNCLLDTLKKNSFANREQSSSDAAGNAMEILQGKDLVESTEAMSKPVRVMLTSEHVKGSDIVESADAMSKPVRIKLPSEHVKLLRNLHLKQHGSASISCTGSEEDVGIENSMDVSVLSTPGMFYHFLQPIEDPLKNYEHVMFGKQGKIVCVCAICRKQFLSVDVLLRHHWKKHPSIDFRFIEVEQGSDADLLFFPWPCNFGLLASALPIAEDYRSLNTYRCTRCAGKFKNINRLHVHIISCDPNHKPAIPNNKKKRIQKRIKAKIDFKNKESVKNTPKLNPVVENPIAKKVENKGFTGCRKRRMMRNVESVLKVRKKRNYELLYNPHNHVRRREMTSLLETHQCSGCKAKFKTLHLLERHATKCSNKETLQNLKPVQNKFIDEVTQKRRHICHYCSKHFIYLKSLDNHYRAFCSVRKEKMRNGLIMEDDLDREKQVRNLLEGQELSKLELEHDKTDGKKRKGGWPKGMKRKKGHKKRTWTIVKRRKPNSPRSDASGEVLSSPLWNVDLYQDYSEVVNENFDEKMSEIKEQNDDNNDDNENTPSSNFNFNDFQKTPEKKNTKKSSSNKKRYSLKKKQKSTDKKMPGVAVKKKVLSRSPSATRKLFTKNNDSQEDVTPQLTVKPLVTKKRQKLTRSKPMKRVKQNGGVLGCGNKNGKSIKNKRARNRSKNEDGHVTVPLDNSSESLPPTCGTGNKFSPKKESTSIESKRNILPKICLKNKVSYTANDNNLELSVLKKTKCKKISKKVSDKLHGAKNIVKKSKDSQDGVEKPIGSFVEEEIVSVKSLKKRFCKKAKLTRSVRKRNSLLKAKQITGPLDSANSSCHELLTIIAKEKSSPIVKIIKVDAAKQTLVKKGKKKVLTVPSQTMPSVIQIISKKNIPRVKKSKKRTPKLKVDPLMVPDDSMSKDKQYSCNINKNDFFLSKCSKIAEETSPSPTNDAKLVSEKKSSNVSPKTAARSRLSPCNNTRLASGKNKGKPSPKPAADQMAHPSCNVLVTERKKSKPSPKPACVPILSPCSGALLVTEKSKSKSSPKRSPKKLVTSSRCSISETLDEVAAQWQVKPDPKLPSPPRYKAIKRLFQDGNNSPGASVAIDTVFKKQKSSSVSKKAMVKSKSVVDAEVKQKSPRKVSPFRASKMKNISI